MSETKCRNGTSFREMGAGGFGLPILLEVFDHDVDKKSLIGPAPLAKRLAEEIRKEHRNFGLMVDLSHIPQLHESIEESLLPVKDYILHAHMGNCVCKDPSLPGYGDLHPRFGFPAGDSMGQSLAIATGANHLEIAVLGWPQAALRL